MHFNLGTMQQLQLLHVLTKGSSKFRVQGKLGLDIERLALFNPGQVRVEPCRK